MNARLLLTAAMLSGAAAIVDAQLAKLSEADRARRATVLATFEGGKITVGDLEDDIANQCRFMRKRYLDEPERRK